MVELGLYEIKSDCKTDWNTLKSNLSFLEIIYLLMLIFKDDTKMIHAYHRIITQKNKHKFLIDLLCTKFYFYSFDFTFCYNIFNEKIYNICFNTVERW